MKQTTPYFLIGAFALLASSSLYACKGKNTKPANYQDELINHSLSISSPPQQYNAFYKKHIDAEGIPVLSSAVVDDKALLQARRQSLYMLKNIPDVRQIMITNGIKIAIIGKGEGVTDIPEYRYLKSDPNTNWDERARGLGATLIVPVSSGAEENLLCESKDPYFNEDIFIHEFAHSIHLLGLQHIDLNFNTELSAAYNNAMQLGLFKNTYAATNKEEYFAEGVQSWFNVNAQASPPNGIYNHVNTRRELQTYDPALYKILEKYFPDDAQYISCHAVAP